MAVSTLSEAVDNLYTTTWYNMKSNVVDQIYNGSPFWFWMREKKRMKSFEGGRFVQLPLRYATANNIAYVGRGGTVAINDQEFVTTAQYEWRYLTASIVRYGVDDQKNRGKNQIINYAEAKLGNAKDGLANQLESSLFTAQSGMAINGLPDLVANDPTATATIGGIAQNTYTWWRNKAQNMTGLSFAVHGLQEMRTLFNECGTNLEGQYPDIIVSAQSVYEFYEDLVTEQKRIVNQKLGDAGFENVQFKGVPMIWSPSAPAQRLYMLNTKYLYMIYDPQYYFEMTEWKAIPNQVNDRAAQIVAAINLVTDRRIVHGVMHTIDTE